MCGLNNKRTAVGIGCVAWMLLCAPMAAAMDTPAGTDAGTITRDIQSALPEGETRPAQINIPSLPPLKATSGLSVTVNQFIVTGNSAFDSEKLEALLASDTGAEKSFGDLQAAARKITNYYRENGYPVARAYLPQQELDVSGIVRIAILEGVTGAVSIAGPETLIDWVGEGYASVLNTGELVNSPDLERAMLLLNDLPGVHAKANLKAGAGKGTTDIDISLDAETGVTGFLALNNYGTDYNGEYRLMGGASVNNMIGIGDQLSAIVMGSDTGDTTYGSLAYSMPVGSLGTRVGLSYSNLDSEVGEELAVLGIENDAEIFNINVTHPFIRSRNYNLIAQVGFTNKQVEQTFDDELEASDPSLGSDDELNILSVGVSGDARDGLYGGGVNTYSVSFDIGDVNFDNVTNARIDAEDDFVKLNYDLSRTQRVNDKLGLYGHLRGQFSSERLVSSEQMALGGPNGVRAYGVGEGLGDDATLLTLEARYRLGYKDESFSLRDSMVYGFFDAGYSKPNDALAGTPDDYTRSGFGVGVRLGFDHGINLNASAAFGTRDEPDTESDGNKHLWFQLVKSFD